MHARTCPAISAIGIPTSSAPRRISDTLQSHAPLRDEELRVHPVSLVVAYPPFITIFPQFKVSIFINVPSGLPLFSRQWVIWILRGFKNLSKTILRFPSRIFLPLRWGKVRVDKSDWFPLPFVPFRVRGDSNNLSSTELGQRRHYYLSHQSLLQICLHQLLQ